MSAETAQIPLYRDEPYLTVAPARVTALTEDGRVVLDRTLFYPAGGGQPGDTGELDLAGRTLRVVDAVKVPLGDGAGVGLVLEEGETPPAVGAEGLQRLDADRRLRHMRMHTALHLLSVVIPLPVTGGQIGAEKGRLDFDMPEAPENREALQAALDALVAGNHPVTDEWITDTELDANPGLVKTMSVQPPRGSGRIRLVRIGAGEAPVDLQPCGGTHVRATGEIGRALIGKIEKKGKRNRRVSLTLAD